MQLNLFRRSYLTTSSIFLMKIFFVSPKKKPQIQINPNTRKKQLNHHTINYILNNKSSIITKLIFMRFLLQSKAPIRNGKMLTLWPIYVPKSLVARFIQNYVKATTWWLFMFHILYICTLCKQIFNWQSNYTKCSKVQSKPFLFEFSQIDF